MYYIRMTDCILESPSSLVLGNCASKFVNNLQILLTGKDSVLEQRNLWVTAIES